MQCPSENYRNPGKCCRLGFCLHSQFVNTTAGIQNQSPLTQKPVLFALHLAFYRFPVFFFPNTSPLLLFLKSCRYPLPKAAYCSDKCTDSCPRKPHVSFLAIAPIKVAMRLCLSFIYFPLLPPPLPPSPPSLPFFFFSFLRLLF